MIYFDNAATSYPKPDSVVKAVSGSFVLFGANPGRGGHTMSVKTSEKVFEARQIINSFFNGAGPEFVCFTSNCTESLNIAIKGLVNKGDHIVISSLEHNSVLRPVNQLHEEGMADYSVFDIGKNDDETLYNFKNAFTRDTRLCVITAVSNVFGDILPVRKLTEFAHSRGARVIVDGAQGAGVIPIDLTGDEIDCLCVPGHKGLMGPMGTGVLLLNGVSPKPLKTGGTGTASMSYNQPVQYPECLESGTLNVPGICGLAKGVSYVDALGIENVFKKEQAVCREIAENLSRIKGVTVYLPENKIVNNVLSFNVDGVHSEKVALYLSRYGIAVRGGYHCSALAHTFKGTQKTGTVRISPSYSVTKKDINILLNLVRKIAFENNI